MVSRSATILAIFVVVALLLHSIGWLSPLEGGLTLVLRPVQKFFSRLVLTSEKDSQGVAENGLRSLNEERARLLVENARLKEDREKLLSTIAQQEFLKSKDLNGVAATVIGRSPEGDEQVLILDRGSEAGVSPGQPVTTNEGIFVGIVHEAGLGRSLILTPTNTQIAVAAEVQNGSRSPGLVSGQHGLTMTMRFIPQGEGIEKGQTVVTSAVDERIPANLVIGQINEVFFTTGDLFQSASVTPPLDFQRLRYVTILRLQ